MKILFVYPKYPETFWSFKHVLKFISKKAAFPPLGILTISSMLPRKYERKLIDLNVEELKEKDILWADYIFISAMIVQRDSVLQISERVKQFGKKVVVGGPLFSEANIDDFPYVDHFVLDEGEVTLPMLVNDIESGESVKRFYSSKLKPDITSASIPDWKIMNMKKYATMLVQFSRGCPFDCDFCDITRLNGRIPRTKSPQQLISELDSLYKSGWRGSVFIVDDNFIGNKARVKEVLRWIYRWNKSKEFPFSFLTEASLDLADDHELMSLMAKANFQSVFLGIETPEKDSLQECNKFQNSTRDIEQSVKRIQRNGLQVQGGFILGFDSDPINIFQKQIEFIQQIGVVTAMVGLLNAVPGTKLYSRLRNEGRIVDNSKGNNTDATLNYIPKMNKEVLINGYKDVMKTLYSSKKYYERILTFLEHYRPKMPKSSMSFRDIKALLISVWLLGIIDGGRKYYWKIVTRTLIKHRKAFPAVMTLLIYGFHFKKMTRAL
ncbi:MAG: B12-binding domain-containing radical SAM protein [Nanoarchaeota archaeon]